MSELQVPIRIKRGVGGAPAELLRGELAYNETANELYIGKGASGSNDASGRPIAATVEQLLAPAQFLSALSDVSISSGLEDGDVLTYDADEGEWIAQAVAAASVAWDDVTSKPATFAPSTHAASHATGGADAIAPADIGAAAASHTHAIGDVTNLQTSLDGKASSSHTHSDATTSVAGFMSAGDKTKLDGIASGATANTGTVTSVVGGTGLTGGTITATGTLAVSYGTTAGTACEGNDSRLSDARTPTSHTHAAADITSGLATVATSGAYSDLSGTPTLGTAAAAATSDFVAASAASAFGLTLLDDADASTARTTLGLGSAATSATSDFAAASHTHGGISSDGKIGTTADALVKTGSGGTLTTLGLGMTDQYLKTGTSGPEWSTFPATFAPSAHNHGVTVTLELSGFIEAPEAKTYVLSPAIPSGITITNFKARTGAGSCDLKLQDDGVDITNATLDDVDSDALAEPVSAISASVASGSRLTLVVSDATSSAPEDLAFTVHYTVAVTSANNA